MIWILAGEPSRRYGRPMVILADVARWAGGLPAVETVDLRGERAWSVGGTVFAWERPFRQADIKRFGDDPVPAGPILAVRVADLGEKEAVLAARHRGFFTISHFDGYAAVLVQLDRAAAGPVRELLVDGWFAKAPPKLTRAHADTLHA
jgi:hypothetical protein